MFRVFFRLMLAEHMADKERMEASVKRSNLEWTLLHPVALTDGSDNGAFANTNRVIDKPAVSRNDVARFVMQILEEPKHLFEAVTLSGASAAC